MIEEIKQFWLIFIKIYSHHSKEEITIRVLIPELVTRPLLVFITTIIYYSFRISFALSKHLSCEILAWWDHSILL